MDKKNLMPQAAQPVNRTTTGQMSPELAELSEEALQLHGAAALVGETYVQPLQVGVRIACSYDGDDAE